MATGQTNFNPPQNFREKYEKRVTGLYRSAGEFRAPRMFKNIESAYNYAQYIGEEEFDEQLNEEERAELADKLGIKGKQAITDEHRNMLKRGEDVQEYIQSKRDKSKKNKQIVSSALTKEGDEYSLLITTGTGDQHKINFKHLRVEDYDDSHTPDPSIPNDDGFRMAYYVWTSDDGNQHTLLVQEGIEHTIDPEGAEVLSTPPVLRLSADRTQELRLRDLLQSAVEGGGGHSGGKKRARKTRRRKTKTTRRRKTVSRRR